MQQPPVGAGTVSTHLARFLIDAVPGPDSGRLSRLSDLGPDVLRDDLARTSTQSLLTVWEQLVLTEPRTLIGPRILGNAPIGTFGVWDYLITSGPTLGQSLRRAVEHLASLGDPAAEQLLVEEDGRSVVLRHATGSWGPDVVEAIDLFALALFLDRARAAVGRHLIPSYVTITHRPPARSRQLTELFGTDRIMFGAPYNSIAFTEDDAHAPLPKAQPGLERLLVQHAELLLAASRPVLRWHDRFRMALATAFREDTVSLEKVARRLSLSPRTLQRRLCENGTTWREQVESVRQQHTLDLLRTTDLPLQSVAGRVGYSDARALRRAVRRWEGQTPGDIRSTARSTVPG
ncbi:MULTISPECIES: AraC family transcriptional regulator ligand-binding domain-containing protein [unclassified Streptomyces]|uniref:AraC family transcriptional regulator n=1 Tax=unclassified Streptomyces TaxID=2593676 RepID=UPI0029AB34C2|nr:AraC family transcriptional regulator ligand-binding domain-containing protein [Streptomyces sp. DK15]MDX2389331.1 AraC family transcriptional regulator ligand-binding domain-containing protein [Streptomyces sp. DK15]